MGATISYGPRRAPGESGMVWFVADCSGKRSGTAQERTVAFHEWRHVLVVAYHADVLTSAPDIENLSDDQRAWVVHSAALWREAHRVAADHPGMDPGDVYHALRCLELPPAERLRRGLTRVRRRPHIR